MHNSQEAYDAWYEAVHNPKNINKLQLKDWHKNALLLAPNIKGVEILEVGCGEGDFSIYLKQQGAHVIGVDFSTKAIELAKQKARVQNCKIDFHVADAQCLPFSDAKFDLVISCECLEHIPCPEIALKEMHRILKPTGNVVLTTENYSNAMILLWIKCWLTNKPFNSGEKVQPVDHLFFFWHVKKMLSEAGLQVNKTLGSHHVFLLLPRFHPHSFVIESFKGSFLRLLFKPFARHMGYLAVKKY